MVGGIKEGDDPLLAELAAVAPCAGSSLEASLAELPDNLAYLDCEDCQLQSLEPLERFRKLRVLNISSAPLRSLRGIENFSHLEILYADFGAFDSLEPLRTMPRIRSIDVSCNMSTLADLGPLAACSKLERLYVAHCGVSRLDSLDEIRSLRLLSVVGTAVTLQEIERFRKLHSNCEIWH